MSARTEPVVNIELMTEEQSAAIFSISSRKFAALRDELWMPKPIVLGPRLLRWSRAELIAAIEKMPRQQQPATEPLQLAKRRAAKAGTTEVSQ